MSRLTRRLAAILAIAALAFAQVAVSAFACPGMSEVSEPGVESAADHCTELATPNLCERHCEYGASSVQSAPVAAIVPDVSPLPWRAEPVASPALEQSFREWLLVTRIEDPPLVRFGFLRI